MYEKILEKLKEQRGENSGVSDRSLEDLAKALTVFITDDDALAKVDLKPAIDSINGNISHNAAEAVKNAAIKADKDKKKLDEKKTKEEEEAEQKKALEDKEVPAYMKTFMESQAKQNELLLGEITTLKNDKVVITRNERLTETLKDLPDYLTKPIMSSFEKANFETEEEFDTYLQEVSTQKDTFIQSAKEHGLPTSVPSTVVKKEEEVKGTPEIDSAREVLKKHKEKLESKT